MLNWLVNEGSDLIYDDLEVLLGWVDGTGACGWVY